MSKPPSFGIGLPHRLRARVVGEERDRPRAVREEVDGVADPHRVPVVGVLARDLRHARVGEGGDPDGLGLAAAVALPRRLPLEERHVRQAASRPANTKPRGRTAAAARPGTRLRGPRCRAATGRGRSCAPSGTARPCRPASSPAPRPVRDGASAASARRRRRGRRRRPRSGRTFRCRRSSEPSGEIDGAGVAPLPGHEPARLAARARYASRSAPRNRTRSRRARASDSAAAGEAAESRRPGPIQKRGRRRGRRPGASCPRIVCGGARQPSPSRIACSTGEYAPSSRWSRSGSAGRSGGWAMKRGAVPRRSGCPACTRNGWQR